MNAVILGAKSEIAQGIEKRLKADGWEVEGWARGDIVPEGRFDLCVIALGAIGPVGLWHTTHQYAWEHTFESNILAPVRLLRMIWPQHNSRCAVCFLAGSNPQTIMDGYSAYNTSKMALLKLVEQLDHETHDARFFALGPGTILTKIHRPTLEAEWDNPKLKAAMAKPADKEAQMQRVYDCLMWAIKQEKAVIGGRNLCASDPWDTGGFLAETLKRNPVLYKLRRMEP